MCNLLCASTLMSFYISIVAAGNILGYHYEKPSVSLSLVTGPTNLQHGHSFAPLSTVQPLPPVPNLPPLPTPRSKNQFIQTQAVYQTHPIATLEALPDSYVSSLGSNIGKIAQQYQPPLLAQQSSASSVKSRPTGYGFSSVASASTGVGSNPSKATTISTQPLRVPFGKQAIITFPSGSDSENSYEANGRLLKQYAVIEIIDNDIEQYNQPFLGSPFFDSYRARFGTTGKGATPEPLGRRQLGSRSNSALFGQQPAAYQSSASDAVALGSGGLGFIRLANGNVYLGSGSLGYVSGQQHTQEINEARTRTGAHQPDALHFGHGPLGAPNRF